MANHQEAIGYGTVGNLGELFDQIEARRDVGKALLGEAIWIPGAKIVRTPTEERAECPPGAPVYTVRVGREGVIDFSPYN